MRCLWTVGNEVTKTPDTISRDDAIANLGRVVVERTEALAELIAHQRRTVAICTADRLFICCGNPGERV